MPDAARRVNRGFSTRKPHATATAIKLRGASPGGIILI